MVRVAFPSLMHILKEFRSRRGWLHKTYNLLTPHVIIAIFYLLMVHISAPRVVRSSSAKFAPVLCRRALNSARLALIVLESRPSGAGYWRRTAAPFTTSLVLWFGALPTFTKLYVLCILPVDLDVYVRNIYLIACDLYSPFLKFSLYSRNRCLWEQRGIGFDLGAGRSKYLSLFTGEVWISWERRKGRKGS